MVIITSLLVVCTAAAFFAGLIQGWASYVEMKKQHYGQQRKFYMIISIYVVLTLIFAGATYTTSSGIFATQTKNDQHAQTSSPNPYQNNSGQSSSSQNNSGTVRTPTPRPVQPGTVLCKEDWQNGMDGWSGTSDWKIAGGMLVNDGTAPSNYNHTLLAPCQISTSNYAVEAKIQYIKGGYGFGVLSRGGGDNGYEGWITVDSISTGELAAEIVYASQTPFDYIVQKPYAVDDAWHTYRLEVKDLNLAFYIDGTKIADTTDPTYLSAGRVGLTVNGLWSGCQIYVKSFQVTAL